MAISANTVFEVRTGGSDTLNSGGFVTGASGVDRSQQDAFHIDLSTDSVVNATTTTIDIHNADHTVSNDDVGNLYNNTGGTSTAGLYEIVSVNVGSNQWVLDRSIGTAGQTVTGGMGGAWATPGKAAAVATVSGNKIYVKDGTYTLSTSTPGAGGPFLLASGIAVLTEGYSATRGDQAATPTLDAGAQTGVVLWGTAGTTTVGQSFTSLKADGQAGAGNIGFQIVPQAGRSTVLKCIAVDCVTGFDGTLSRAQIIKCFADTCSTAGFTDCVPEFSVAKSCGIGFITGTTASGPVQCLAYLCTTGFQFTAQGGFAHNCTADACTSVGFDLGTTLVVRCINCLATNQSGAGDSGFLVAGTVLCWLINCAGYNNTAHTSGTFLVNQGFITLTADPYVDQASADFRSNTTSGGGASLRAAGIVVYGQTDTVDVGAVQSATSSGSRTFFHPGMNGGVNG